VVVLSLGIGLAACALVFSVVYGLNVRPLPSPHPEQLVQLMATTDPGCRQCIDVFPPSTFVAWQQARPQSLQSLSAYAQMGVRLAVGQGSPTRATAAYVDSAFSPLLATRPVVGRTLSQADFVPVGQPVVVLSHTAWRLLLGARPDAIGASVRLNDRTYTVVGVMPPTFNVPPGTTAWTPFPSPALLSDTSLRLVGIGRLGAGVTIGQARAEMELIARRLELADSATNAGRGVAVLPLLAMTRGGFDSSLWLLFGGVGFAFLIACANAGILALVRTLGREREIAVRAALGAGRARIARQLLCESAVLTAASMALGLLIAKWGAQIATSLVSSRIDSRVVFSLEPWAVALMVMLAFVTSAGISVAPLTQLSSLDVQTTLRSAGGGTTPRGQRRLRGGLVTLEVAVSMVLLTATGLLLSSYLSTQRFDLGFDARRLLTVSIDLAGPRYQDPRQVLLAASELRQRLEREPGVASAAVWSSTSLPFLFRGAVLRQPVLSTEGQPDDFILSYRDYPMQSVDGSPELLGTLGIQLVRGRNFGPWDVAGSERVAILSEDAVERLWPGEAPIGKRFKIGPPSAAAPLITVVGVVRASARIDRNGLFLALFNPGRRWPAFYRPLAQTEPKSITLAIRVSAEVSSMNARVRDIVRAALPDQVVDEVSTLQQQMSRSGHIGVLRLQGLVLGGLAAISVALALIGVYGVVADSVRRRTTEIGIRRALGARGADIARLVARESLALVGVGTAIGLLTSLALRYLYRYSLLYKVAGVRRGLLIGETANGIVLLGACCAAVLLVGAAATFLPARRACRVEPAEALRCE
jgi:predicted permease